MYEAFEHINMDLPQQTTKDLMVSQSFTASTCKTLKFVQKGCQLLLVGFYSESCGAAWHLQSHQNHLIR